MRDTTLVQHMIVREGRHSRSRNIKMVSKLGAAHEIAKLLGFYDRDPVETEVRVTIGKSWGDPDEGEAIEVTSEGV